jgi:hypothetical protein
VKDIFGALLPEHDQCDDSVEGEADERRALKKTYASQAYHQALDAADGVFLKAAWGIKEREQGQRSTDHEQRD